MQETSNTHVQVENTAILLAANPLHKRHLLLNLPDSQRRVKSLGTGPRAVENRVTPVQAHAVVHGVQALMRLLVSRVVDPAVRLKEDSGAEILFLVPPVRWAGGAAASAENALVETVELLTVRLGLEVFTTLENVLDSNCTR